MVVKKARKKTAVKVTAVKRKPAKKKHAKKAQSSDTQALVKHLKHFVNEVSKSIQKLVSAKPKRKAAKRKKK